MSDAQGSPSGSPRPFRKLPRKTEGTNGGPALCQSSCAALDAGVLVLGDLWRDGVDVPQLLCPLDLAPNDAGGKGDAPHLRSCGPRW